MRAQTTTSARFSIVLWQPRPQFHCREKARKRRRMSIFPDFIIKPLRPYLGAILNIQGSAGYWELPQVVMTSFWASYKLRESLKSTPLWAACH
jgi:hypothetical protein